MTTVRFPRGFVFGVATSAFQIEGGRHEGGRGDSIWDRFSDMGRLAHPGDVTCDHFHRWEEDVDLLADLGVDAYRFSVSWPRVIPDGSGEVNREGLGFYDRLVDRLLDRGITPYPTLYHWDLPQALQDEGGWAVRGTVDAFVRYASVVVEALGDRVTRWMTHNEPWVATMLGHKDGLFAPGLSDWPTAISVGHHILLSHGRATNTLRTLVPGAKVGLALDCRPAYPASSSEADIEATRHFDGFRNRWFFDPVFGLGYPDDMVGVYSDRGHFDPALVHPGDMEEIASPIDFLGLNYYTTAPIRTGHAEAEETEVPPGPEPPNGFTEMGWRIDPDGLETYLEHLHRTYAPPSILITENGASYSTGPDANGVIDDRLRVAYLDLHLRAVASARAKGVPVDGYFAWSMLDNLEWLHGFDQRFGLVWVDPDTGRRIPKRSFEWYARVIAARALPAS